MTVTIVGAGEVGRVFQRCAESGDQPVEIVRRGEIVQPGEGPVIVAVREDDLAALAGSLGPVAGRCVFVQNGLVDEVLAPLGSVTRGLIWFTAKGTFFRELAPSLFHGPRAAEAAAILESGGIAARVEPSADTFLAETAVKLAWNNVVGLPLAVHGVKLGEYLAEHAAEARAIVAETCEVLAREWHVAIDSKKAYARVLATTADLSWVTGGTKAIDFRNGAVVRRGRALGVPAPVNARLVSAAQS